MLPIFRLRLGQERLSGGNTAIIRPAQNLFCSPTWNRTRDLLLPLFAARSEQFAVRSSAVKCDSTARNPVDQQPVRIDMALGKTGVVAFEAVLPEGFRQRLSPLKQLENVFQRLVIENVGAESFLQAAEISFEAPREDDLLHRRLRCATASFAVVKRRTLPSRSSRRDCSSARRAAAFSS